ncbi:helitron helicase-like domain-containing protein [Artemisia annua]|uniref:Helitron helicase-like domain-containing protein n=1 Tax=Artemisia annua TaxID=35608 RepID=A0A2U1PXP4_ARTAN|nr:helitron helicase-like domain-containing protein [Artemisia annua]
MVATCDTGTSAQILVESAKQVACSTVPALLSSNLGDPPPAIQLDRSAFASAPVQVTAVDGLASTFTVSHVISNTFNNPQHSDVQIRIQGGSSAVPMVLDFSGAASSDAHASSSQTPTVARRRRRPRSVCAPAIRRRSDAGMYNILYSASAKLYDGRTYAMGVDTSPMQGPIAPPQRQGAPTDYKYFGRCDQLCQHCHAMFWLEEKRTGLPVSAAPQHQRCCARGRASVRTYQHYPVYITDLFSDRHFMDNIRAYNQMFAMTSFGATIENSINTGRGPYVFRVSGQIYHWIGGFCPENDDTPRFLQMYVYDTDHEVQNRLSHFDPHERQRLREDIVEGLIDFLNDNNALVQLFRTARDKLREAEIPDFQIRLFGVAGSNQYELPVADSIGAIVDTDALSKAVAHPPVPHRSLAYFADLKPTDNTKFIEARVYRKWTAMKVPSLIATGFSCILLDKKGSAIQAKADLKEKERFERDLQANCVYRIEGFGFEKTDGWGKTLDNDFTLLSWKAYTIYIINEQIPCSNNVILFTLWNEKAENFEEEEYAQMRQPVILAVSSCYLKRYGGIHRHLLYTLFIYIVRFYLTAYLLYNQENAQAPQLEVQTERLTDWEQERSRNRVPLGTLLQIDPNTQQRVLFTQEAMILQVDTAHDWYYQKCDECGGKLDYGYSFRVVITDGTGNAVMTCFSPQTDGLIKDVNTLLQEVADKNPTTTPPQILALQNTRHVFQFRFAKPTAKGPPTFVLQKVMDHPPSLLLAATEGPSSAPTTPPDSLAHSHTSPPPTTPATTQKIPTDASAETSLPTTSAVRKELFKHTADEETYLGTVSAANALTVTKKPIKGGTAQESPLESVNLPSISNVRKEVVKGSEGEENDPETKKQKLE